MARKKATRHNDELFRKTFEEGFKKQFQNGLLQGSRAMCKVVYDRASDESKPAQERLDYIKSFCGVLLNLPTGTKVEEAPVEAEVTEESKPE